MAKVQYDVSPKSALHKVNSGFSGVSDYSHICKVSVPKVPELAAPTPTASRSACFCCCEPVKLIRVGEFGAVQGHPSVGPLC